MNMTTEMKQAITLDGLIAMLGYCRPEGSKHQKRFCNRFIKPFMGTPDDHGNYTLTIGQKPRIAFMAHHDTVHKVSARQSLVISEGIVSLPLNTNSSCLGADCTTGVWLILNMIAAGIEGVYVIHAAEEIGCLGSQALVYDNPAWLDHIDAAISFDRYGTESIITHQMGLRTCSEGFSKSLAGALGLPLKSDPDGVYTDSNEYADIVPECTNLSVGYYAQHTKRETQDLGFAAKLVKALIAADWSSIVIARDPTVTDVSYAPGRYDDFDRGPFQTNNLERIVELYPERVAELLEQLGYDAYSLSDALEIGDDISAFRDTIAF